MKPACPAANEIALGAYAGQFSPDGRWVAYQSDESGLPEVYVAPFPRIEGKSQRWQISAGGGGLPKWRGDGKELYYIMGNGKMMAVTVGSSGAFTVSAPRMLFRSHTDRMLACSTARCSVA